MKDAANTPGGHSEAVAMPKHEGHIAFLVENHESLLVIGAQSSLTGGATPFGETVVSTLHFDKLEFPGGEQFIAGAGVPLVTLQQQLKERALFYPPVPTFDGAFAGGVVATNAAGAQTFKYGTTRDWVEALTIVLANGEVLDIQRGQTFCQDRRFEIQSLSGTILELPVPTYQPPKVAKCSAGYHAADNMDLIDLFIGSEGTLGLVTEIRFRCIPLSFKISSAFLTIDTEQRGLELVGRLRKASQRTWRGEGSGLDIAAVESLDKRSLELLREDGQDKRSGVSLPEDHDFAIFFQFELPIDADEDSVMADIEQFMEDSSNETAVGELCQILSDYGVLEDLEIALPGDEKRAKQLFEVRDRVPTIVNHKVADAQRLIDGRIHKTAADMIVPFENFAAMLDAYRHSFGKRGLDYAIWGHISDGNVHPNVLPRSHQDMVAGKEALLELGEQLAALGGCPLAEHGVGRNPLKQALLLGLYGEQGIEQMRQVKQALDPNSLWAPGVLFPARRTTEKPANP